MDALIGRQVHLVAGLDVERLVPSVDVADDAVDPILRRAVLVGQQLGTQGAFALLGLPAVAVGDEEALVAGEAVDDRRLAMLGDIFAIGRVGDFEAAEIAEVLAERELSLDVDPGNRLIAVVLGYQLVGMRGVQLRGGRAPPVGELAVSVELAALVVEAVPDFMSDRRADAAVV